MAGAVIRPFRRDDTEAVVALWRAAGLVVPWNDPYRDIERKLTVQPELFLVAEDASDGAPVVVGAAMVGYDGHRGWVNYLAVDESRRGEGLGAAIMAEAERLLVERGCPKLNLQVRSTNQGVIDWYRSLGYEPDHAVSLGKRLIPDGPDAPAARAPVGTAQTTPAQQPGTIAQI